MPEDVRLGKFDIPKDTNIFISPYLLARNPEVYPDPLKFDPTRFEGETTTATKNSFAFISFSAGSRNCIGQKFAMLEMKSLVAKVLMRFEILLAKENEDLQVTVDLTLTPIDGPVLCANLRN